ncbi:MAG: nuclear transport factor 2 family protein [Methanobrevibacter sp.]|uniref:nuclear transport factor 2 family protein n=1 Tax=Methanobrevibacter sp. TaxID=66852 RepID=UPI0025FF2E7E|nr:nuclear transport factor 2 family protein [Methanobrevibacter sp.]MBE6509017.1 nuclear transport factor 2 family protein [Methanobrevibacter sp.]
MNVSVINKKQLTQDQEDVLGRFIEFQRAMIEKDSEKLNEIMNDNYTLTHMSGKTQTKEEYVDEIMDGTLNYYESTIDNPSITIKGNKALLKADVTLDAKVYGMKGTWTLHSRQTMEKIGEKWYLSKWEN